MDIRYIFNENVLNYDKFRPLYPQKIFRDIIDYSVIDYSSKALEIGIGTGQATLPILQTGCHVTAVELGEDLGLFTQAKFDAYANFEVIISDFEDFMPSKGERYDLIYAATAYHWINNNAGFEKLNKLLKPGATVALFWNRPFPNRESDASNLANRQIYNKYRPSNKLLSEFSEKDCKKWVTELEQQGFSDVKSSLYHRVRTLTTEEYIGLLNTYSDHCMLSPIIKSDFERDMRQAINNLGGNINIYDTLDLYLARKPLI